MIYKQLHFTGTLLLLALIAALDGIVFDKCTR